MKTKLPRILTLKQRQHRLELASALRSGKYEQTTGKLHNDHGFCVLGVACDISGLGNWNRENDLEVYIFETASGSSSIEVLKEVQDYYGFDTDEGDNTGSGCFMYFNDIGMWSFDQFAGYLEESCKEGNFTDAENIK